MGVSNHSPLLKDSQELTKTKGTIWKPLITVSLLSVFSFISGQYLPYVIIAVSGSGPIAAVPLAIFAVSTAVALISTIYLIRLAVSRADNKKEEPQKFVCENCTNLENKSSVHTPQQPPLTFGTAIPQNNDAPLPPPPMPTTQSPPVTFGIQPNPSVSAPPPPPPPPSPLSSGTPPSPPTVQTMGTDMLADIKKGKKLRNTKESEEKRKKQEAKKPGDRNQQHPGDLCAALKAALNEIKKAKGSLDSESEDEHENDGYAPDNEWNEEEDEYQRNLNLRSDHRERSGSLHSECGSDEDHTPNSEREDECSTTSTLQSDHRERSESPDSGQGSGTTSPSHSVPKVDKPPESPKPKNKPAAAQVNNAAVNSKMKEPSTSSVNEQRKVKKLASFWENQGRI